MPHSVFIFTRHNKTTITVGNKLTYKEKWDGYKIPPSRPLGAVFFSSRIQTHCLTIKTLVLRACRMPALVSKYLETFKSKRHCRLFVLRPTPLWFVNYNFLIWPRKWMNEKYGHTDRCLVFVNRLGGKEGRNISMKKWLTNRCI